MKKESISTLLSYSPSKIVAMKRKVTRTGDTKALLELSNISQRLAKIANRRLNILEKHGKTQYAYDMATSFTDIAYGTKRYDEYLSDPEAMMQQILSARKFLLKETSTLKGYKRVEAERIKAFRETMDISQEDMSDRKLQNFLKFLGEQPIRQLISESHKWGSEEQVDLFREKLEAKPSARAEIIEAVRRYNETERGGDLVPKEKRLHYDDLQKYLRGEINLKFTPNATKIIKR